MGLPALLCLCTPSAHSCPRKSMCRPLAGITTSPKLRASSAGFLAIIVPGTSPPRARKYTPPCAVVATSGHPAGAGQQCDEQTQSRQLKKLCRQRASSSPAASQNVSPTPPSPKPRARYFPTSHQSCFMSCLISIHLSRDQFAIGGTTPAIYFLHLNRHGRPPVSEVHTKDDASTMDVFLF